MGGPGAPRRGAARLGLDARERALATRLAYGAVQRRATLDHLIETLAGRPGRAARAARAAPRCGSASTSSPTSTACPPTRPSASPSSSSSASRRAAPSSSTPCCAAARARPRRLRRGAAASARRPRPRCATPTPSGSPRCGSTRSGPDDARALMAARQRAGRGRAAREHAARPTPAALAARAAGRRRIPRPACPRGSCSTAPFDAFASPLWDAGPLHAAVARRDGGRARCSAPRPGERVLDLCAAPGRQDDPSRRADGGPRRARRRRAPSRAAPTRCGAPPRAWAPTRRRPHRATPPRRRTAEPFDRVLVDPPCSDLGTLASRPDARWRKPPDLPERLAREQAAILRAGAARTAPRRHARLLDLHDLARRERGRRAGVPGRARGLHAPTTCASDVPLWDHARVPGFPQTLPHRDGTEGFFIARLRREGGRVSEDEPSTSATSARPATSRGCARRTCPAATAA